jgi:hypothetical protein
VARRVEIDEHWSRPLEELRVGDHVTRTVEATVAGVTGGHLPELDHGRSQGLTILPGQTRRSTEIDANEVIGRISRSFELRIDSDQPINISPVRLVWWNTDTEIEWRSAAKATRLEPLPRDVDGLVRALMTEAREAHRTGRYGITAMIALFGIGLFLALALLVMATRKRSPEDRALLDAIRENPQPINGVRALLAWGETVFPGHHPLSLERLGQRLGKEAGRHLADLQRAAFGPGARSIDVLDVTESIIAEARRRRGRDLLDIGIDAVDHLIGPKRHLPEIGGIRKPL